MAEVEKTRDTGDAVTSRTVNKHGEELYVTTFTPYE